MQPVKITLISEITVHLEKHVGDDGTVLAARQASTDPEEARRLIAEMPGEEQYGRIRHAMRMHHTSCFEHGLMTFSVHAPAFVWWEWVRHRFQAVDCPDLSFNLESGRYKELEPVFWVPRADRRMVPVQDYRPARPLFEIASSERYEQVRLWFRSAYMNAWMAYRDLREQGIAAEVVRSVLGFGVYYSGFCSGNPLAWLNFLAKRTHEPTARDVSYPLAEIEEAARQVEAHFACYWPLTHRAFNECGRVVP